MQLKLSTDYAIRIVLYLSSKNEKSSLEELSQKLGINKKYVLKFSKKLYSSGIVNIYNNTQEDISLAKSPSEITMFDIINSMENTIKVNLCLEEDKYCSRFAIDNCPVRKFYCKLQDNMENLLKNTTIEVLLEKNGV